MRRQFLRALAGAFLALVPVISAAQALEEFLKAVNAGDAKTVAFYLDKGLDPDTADPDGNTVLMIAARLGYMDVVTLLVNRKASVARRSAHGDTALMFACLKGHLEIARLLVAHGAQINQTAWTPLHYAAFEGRAAVISYLIEKGADKDALAPNGFTALMLAARGGHIEAMRALLYDDANVAIKGPKGETALSIARTRKDEAAEALLKRAGAAD